MQIMYKIRNVFSIALILWIAGCSPRAAFPIKEPKQAIAMDIITLASDDMEGREIGTEGERKASEYLEKRFRELGLKPAGDNGSYFQTFSRKQNRNPHSTEPNEGFGKEIKGRNVVAMIDNKASSTVVIGAHYDHLGYGQEGSLYTGDRAVHNGADDNASGVSGVLYLAESIKKGKLKKHNYLFVCFSGEEKGLWGSNFFVNNAGSLKNSMNYMINMDMIGRLNAERKLSIGGVGTSPEFDRVLNQIKYPSLQIKKELSGMGPSDHASFYNAGVPVLGFFTGQHGDYHKPSDDHQLINYGGTVDVLEYIYMVVKKLDKKPKLAYTRTQDETETRITFTVSLGLMPDYLYDGKGLKIDGVRDGKPAQAGGLQKGDIITKMGDTDVPDIQAYMKTLSSLKAGQQIMVTIIRNGQEIQKPITL